MKVDVPLFPVAVAAHAALLEPGTLRMWFVRGAIKLSPDDQPNPGEGQPRLLTFLTVLRIACANALVRAGTDVKDAVKAADEWVMFGSDSNDAYHRYPGGVYPDGVLAVLIHYGGGHAKIVPVETLRDRQAMPEHRGKMLFRIDDLFPSGYPVRNAAMLVPLDWVYKYASVVCQGYLRDEGQG